MKPFAPARLLACGLMVSFSVASATSVLADPDEQSSDHAQIGGAAPAHSNQPILLTTGQKAIDQLALALLETEEAKAAREQQKRTWLTLPPAQTEDGMATLENALDGGIFQALRGLVRDPARPSFSGGVIAAHSYGGLSIPSSQFFGDNSDRIYRSVAVSSEYTYQIIGRRNTSPSNTDFSFETPSQILYAKDIDVADDGSFSIIVDTNPTTPGQRNHITLTPQTTSVLVRDTLADWNNQLPNSLEIKRTDSRTAPPAPTLDTLRPGIISAVQSKFVQNNNFLKFMNLQAVNDITPIVRSDSDGLIGNVGALNPFSLKDDEALVFTVVPFSAEYVGIQTLDPWTRSVEYKNDFGSLSDKQVQKNPDGSITYILSVNDPGYYNWLSTGKLHTGGVLLRLEGFSNPKEPDIVKDKLIRDIKLVRISDLRAELPESAIKVTAKERAMQLEKRKQGFLKRVQ